MTDRGTINCGANSNSTKTEMNAGDTVSFKNTTSGKEIDLTLPDIFDPQPTSPVLVGKGNNNNTVGPYTVKTGATKGDHEYSWKNHGSPTAGTRTGTISVED